MSATDDGQILLTERRGDVLLATLNRPAKANALSNELIGALGALADRVARESAEPGGPRALVLTGAGSKAFSAGADISNLRGLTADVARDQMLRGQAVFGRIASLPIAVIAAVNGLALGGGLELAMACDLRVAATTARFAQPEITLGNIPGWGGTQRLPRLVGRGAAAEMILTGTMIDAERALAIGLVNHVDDDCVARALDIATVIATRSRPAVAAAKRVIDIGLAAGIDRGLTAEAAAVGEMCETEEQHAAVAAFLAERSARHSRTDGPSAVRP